MVRRESRERLVGIDWLEMYVNEGYGWDYTADGFRARGYLVQEREYGTKTMAQMFTIMDAAGHPFIEIRREPRGLNAGAKQTVYKEGDSYVKLANMYCYDANPVGLMLDFLSREKYEIKKIYRIDLYTDFEIFDSGDKPANVVRRIVNHTYSKINQSHRRVSGTDTWTECFDNWISWGKPGSMVSTKIYDKTKELKETGMHKPYIVETEIIGAMNAKELPKNAGTFPFEQKWNINVPIPAVNIATEGLIPTNNGTKTVAPNIANKCCILNIHSFIPFLKFILFIITPYLSEYRCTQLKFYFIFFNISSAHNMPCEQAVVNPLTQPLQSPIKYMLSFELLPYLLIKTLLL